jgi:hypothetical protein
MRMKGEKLVSQTRRMHHQLGHCRRFAKRLGKFGFGTKHCIPPRPRCSSTKYESSPIKLKSTLPKSDTSHLILHTGTTIETFLRILFFIDDYNHALKLRTATLGKFDKKVADSHFLLAAVYAEAPNRVGENEGRWNIL